MLKIKSFKKNNIHQIANQHDTQSIDEVIQPIRAEIEQNGDVAVIAYTKKFDAPKIDNTFQLKVTDTEIKEAYELSSPEFLTAIQHAVKNVQDFHKHQCPDNWIKTSPHGYEYGMQYSAIDTVGLYVPGGRALYPSSVVMNAVPAAIAGVSHLVMATPPQKDGSIAPEILVAAAECGIHTIIKAGGAQAIFAMAQGTMQVPRVDKIVGPGNAYVDRAKQLVYGMIDIDKPAGPSEVLVYVTDKTYAAYAAAEVLAQCEHDPSASGIVLSTDKAVLEAVNNEIKSQLPTLKRSNIIKKALKNSALYYVESEQEALEAINGIATEHLCLITDNAKALLPHIKHAGAIFCGPYTPVALGDYIAGPNHVLPTARAARFASPLSITDFMKFSTVLECSKGHLQTLSKDVKTLTEIETFDAHFATLHHRLK